LAKLIQAGLVVEGKEGRLRRYYPGKALPSALVDASAPVVGDVATHKPMVAQGVSTVTG